MSDFTDPFYDPDADPNLDLDAEAQAVAESVAAETGDAAAPMEREMAELTADLQRLQAEYANYRKRVDRDKGAARELAVGEVLFALLPLLDDFGRAREHGELTGAFKSVSDAFDAVVNRFGLETFGAVGEAFDPMVHEAMSHTSADGDGPHETVITAVYQSGYRHAGRVLRPARVAVADQPAPDSASS